MNWLLKLTPLAVLIATGCSEVKKDNPLTTNNLAPTVELLGFEADTLVYVANRVYPFEFMATDDGSKELAITLKVLGETGTASVVDKTTAGLYRASFTPFQKGDHVVEIAASDGLETTTGVLNVNVGDNRSPVAVIAVRTVERDLSAQEFTYEFDASLSFDKDQGDRIVKASWDLDGNPEESTITQKVIKTFDYYANYEIKLTVEDSFGAATTTSMVIDNSLPLASFEIRPTSQARNGDNVTLDGSDSISPRAEIISYKWLSRHATVGTNVLTELTESVYRYLVEMPVGNNDIGLIVHDEEGSISDTTWGVLTVLNRPPDVNFTFTTATEQIIVTESQVSDQDMGDVVTLMWYLDGVRLPEFDDASTPVINVRGAVYQLTLTAMDDHGAASSATKTVSVPGLPEADFLFPDDIEDNYEAHNGITLLVDGSSSIAGNESRGVETYIWTLRPEGDVAVIVAQGRSSTLSLPLSHELGDYEIGLKIINREGVESSTISKSMTIVNSPPVAAFTCDFQAFTTAIVYRILSNTSSDPDPGEVFTYRWFLDGVEQAHTGATPTFTRSHTEFVNEVKLVVEDTHGGVGEKSVDDGCNGLP